MSDKYQALRVSVAPTGRGVLVEFEGHSWLVTSDSVHRQTEVPDFAQQWAELGTAPWPGAERCPVVGCVFLPGHGGRHEGEGGVWIDAGD